MTVDPTYIKAAIETLELIHKLYTFLKENQKVNELSNQLSQIEMKANARIESYLVRTLKILIPLDDPEGMPTEYWKGVRDMASYAIKQWNHFQDEQKFVASLKTTRSSLLAIITPTKQDVSPLEEILNNMQDQDIEANSEEQLTPQDTSYLDSPPSSLPEKFEILNNIPKSKDESNDDRDLEPPPTPYNYEFPYPKGPPVASAEAIPIKEEDQDIEANSEEQLTPQDTSHLDSPTSSLPEKLLDDNDELLSSTLKDALRILRDEVDTEENGSPKICPECRFANKSDSEICTQCHSAL